MSRIKLIGIFFAVVLVVLLVPIVMLYSVDINNYRDNITTAVQNATGRHLAIQGNISKSIFPRLGFTVRDTQLGNPDGFTGPVFASIANLQIYVQIMPLLSKKLVVDKIVADGLQLNLHRKADASDNWSFAAKQDGQTAQQAPADTGAADDRDTPVRQPAPDLSNVNLAGVEIRNTSIDFRDDAAQQHFRAEKLDLQIGTISGTQPVEVTLSTQIKSEQPKIYAQLQFASTLRIDQQQYGASINKLAIDAIMPSLLKVPLKLGLSANVSYNQADGSIAVKAAKLSSGPLQLAADMEQISGTPQMYKGNLTLSKVNLHTVFRDYGIKNPLPHNPQALQSLDLKTDFTLTPKQVSLANLNLHVDDSAISGEVGKVRFDTLAAQWKLQIDKLDLNTYLPPDNDATPAAPATAPAAAPSGKAAAASNESAPILPVQLIKELNLDGRIQVAKLSAKTIQAQNVNIGIFAKRGKLQVQPLDVNINKGAIKGSVIVDVAQAQPQLRVVQRVSDIALGSLLNELVQLDYFAPATSANLDMDVTANGNTVDAWTNSLHGKTTFLLKDGSLNKISLSDKLLSAIEKIRGKPLSPDKLNQQTVFDEIKGSLDIDKGIANTRDLRAHSPELDVAGKGWINLPKQTLHLVLDTTILKLPRGWAREELDTIIGKPVPVTIKGPFSDIKYDPDVKSVLKKAAKKALKRQQDKLKKKINQKQKEELHKLEQEGKEKIEAEKNRLKERLKKLF